MWTATPWEGTGGQSSEEIERELHEKLSAVLSDPKYGCTNSNFGGSHVSGTLHLHHSKETEHTHETEATEEKEDAGRALD